MKKFYSLIIVALVFIAAAIPLKNYAQCSCAGGVTPDSTVYTYVLGSTNAPISSFTFPQFDPSTGTLNCVLLNDTITGISTTGVRNLASVKVKYKFQLTVSNDIEGPGISVNEVFNKIYGPDSLDIFGNPTDTITYGPDTVFNNIIDASYSSSVGAYLGVGTVGFDYTINGGLIALQGGLNYRDQIITNYYGVFKLTYYWCPLVILANSIKNFSAIKQDNTVKLHWYTENEQKNITYEIQFSKDGKQYGVVGNKPSSPATTGTLTEYQYQYNPHPADVGTIYFRIKRVDASGKITYTAARAINLDALQGVGIQTYPNPIVRTITMLFEENKTGKFLVELVNTSGQLIQQKELTLTSSNQIIMDLDKKPSRGLYLIRAKEISNNKQYTTKVLIN